MCAQTISYDGYSGGDRVKLQSTTIGLKRLNMRVPGGIIVQKESSVLHCVMCGTNAELLWYAEHHCR